MIGFLTALLLAGLIFLVSLQRPQWGLLIVATLVPFHGLLLIAPVTASWWKEAAVLAVVAGALFAPRERDRVAVASFCPSGSRKCFSFFGVGGAGCFPN